MPPAPDLDRYRAELEELLLAPGPAADAAHAHLFEAELVRALAASGPRALARAAAEGYLRRASADEMREARERFGSPVVVLPDGVPVTPGEVDDLLAGEHDTATRRAIGAARLRALESHLARPLRDAAEHRTEAARELGAAGPAALVAGAAGIDIAAAADAAEALIDATDDAHARRLDAAARAALGMPGGAVEAADLPRLVRAPSLAEDLAPGPVGAALDRTAERLVPGALAPPVAGGGVAAALAALRALGAALARGGVSSRLPVEARLCPDPAIIHAHAYLLEGLLTEPAWLRRTLGLAEPEPVAVAAATARLLATRAAAVGAIAVHDPARADFDRAIGVPWPVPLRLAEGLGDLAPVDELRARTLAAAIGRHLREEAGAAWIDDPRSAGLLRELWLEGGRVEADALARDLGAPGLDPALLVDEAAAAPAP